MYISEALDSGSREEDLIGKSSKLRLPLTGPCNGGYQGMTRVFGFKSFRV